MNAPIYKRTNFEPDFNNLLQVFARKIPSRPTLFEFAFNDNLIGKLSGEPLPEATDRIVPFKRLIKSFVNAGYDFTTISAWRTNTLSFPKNEIEKKNSISLNSGSIITDLNSFEKYSWPDPNIGDYEIYYDLKKELPHGMKLIASGNGGLLENAIDLVGFENISLMYMLDENLATLIFDAVGSRLLRFYEIVSSIETVGACIVNDDWGFKNQTMFPPTMLRRWVFPWHKKIVDTIHQNGKIAILHSCGQLKDVMNDVIDYMKYDAKHSFEDQIIPIEEALDIWGRRIALLGGIDIDYLARSSASSIVQRSKLILEKTLSTGGYALGSGNSIPDYIPDENFIAMISSVSSSKNF